MPRSALLIMDEDSDTGGVFVIRYSAEGEFAGDTWHATIDEARREIDDEFGSVSWQEAPRSLPSNDYEFALLQLRKRPTDSARPEPGSG